MIIWASLQDYEHALLVFYLFPWYSYNNKMIFCLQYVNCLNTFHILLCEIINKYVLQSFRHAIMCTIISIFAVERKDMYFVLHLAIISTSHVVIWFLSRINYMLN